jgi:hypothetical protein
MFLTIQKIHSLLLALGYHTDRLFKYWEAVAGARPWSASEK